MREISFLEQFLFSQGARIGCSRLQFPSGLWSTVVKSLLMQAWSQQS
jgi:hypothetical protein